MNSSLSHGLCLLFGVSLLATTCGLEWKTARADSADRSEALVSLVARLADPVASRRQAARQAIRSVGQEALPVLRQAVMHPGYRVRMQAIELLCEIDGGCQLADLECWLSREEALPVCHVLMRALVGHHGGPGAQVVRRLLEARSGVSRPLLQVHFDGILAERVREILVALLSESGNYGFYRGQFGEIVELGPEMVSPLLTLLEDDMADRRLRSLSAGALGALGNRAALAGLQQVERKLSRRRDAGLRTVVVWALHRLGDSRSMRTMIAYYEARAEEKNSRTEDLMRCAYVNFRFGRRDRALVYYARVIRREPGQGLAHYNMACIYSLQGKVDEAIHSLRSAFRGDFDDHDWARKDRDLDFIRKDPRFEAILKEGREDD